MYMWQPKSQAKTHEIYLPARPSGTPVATVYGPNGETIEASATVTVDSANTTISADATLGSQSLSLTSASGVVVGKKYLVGGEEAGSGEEVTIKSISGLTAYLVRPLILSRLSGVSFASSRITVAASAIATCGRGYRIEVSWSDASGAREPLTYGLDVTRYSPVSGLTIELVRDVDPAFTKRLPSAVWWPALLAQSWERVLTRLAAKVEPGALQGAVALSVCHGYVVRETLAETIKDEEYRALMAKRASEELDAACMRSKWDVNADGIPERQPAFFAGIRVRRS